MSLQAAIVLMGLLFLVGMAAVLMLPETKGQPLPEG